MLLRVGWIRSVALLATVALTGCGLIPEEVAPALTGEAPAECGFPERTPLSFAGRSTTALLGVNEVPGDPMSVEPADIYVTRDAFDQGELHGRLVCAIYLNPAGFVEVTVHPADDAMPSAPNSRLVRGDGLTLL